LKGIEHDEQLGAGDGGESFGMSGENQKAVPHHTERHFSARRLLLA
jgi:hypothetical protein